jgi:hypothetical protein
MSTSDDQSALSAPGADDFLPLLIWVVLHCHVPQLVSNCEYIQSFHNPIHLRGKAGYCLVNLRCQIPSLLFSRTSPPQICDGVRAEPGAPRHLPHDRDRVPAPHGRVHGGAAGE